MIVAMLERQATCYTEVLRPQLAEHAVYLVGWNDLSDEQRSEVSRHFDTEISPVLTPLGLDASHPFPYVSNLSTSWAFRLQDPVNDESVLVRVKVPRELRQWIRVHSGVQSPARVFVSLDQVIAANAEKLFPGMVIESASLFRVCRDADVELDDDEGVSKRVLVERELQQRRFEPVVRLEIQPGADQTMLSELMEQFALGEDDVYEMTALLDYTTLFEIAALEIDSLRDPSWTPLPPTSARDDRRRHLHGDPRGEHPPPSPVRQLLRERRAVHPRGRRRPADRLDQDDRVPSGRRHAVRAVADPGGGGREAGRLRDRAERPLRRGAQPPLVARARKGRSARRVRRERPQDPQQGGARDPPGGGRHPRVRAHRHRELSRPHRQPLRGPRAAHGRSGGHPRRRHALPFPDGALAHTRVRDAGRRADEHACRVRPPDRARDRKPRRQVCRRGSSAS